MPSHEDDNSPRRVFGRMLRHYRRKSGLSRPQVAKAICKSVSLVESIESGDRVTTEEVAADLDGIYALDGDLIQLRREMGDSLGYQPYPPWFQDWLKDVEPRARRLRTFQPNVVPGLLQTEDYARAVFGTRFGITEPEVSQRVASRMKRQERLALEDPPPYWAIVDEWVLRRPVGGRHVMAEQLSKLIGAAQRPKVVIRVVPASVGAHEGLYSGGFVIAGLKDGPDIGYLEMAIGGGQLVEETADLEALEVVWDTLRDEALSRSESLGLLEEAAKSWTLPT